jgi:hypothetical protein
MKVTEPAAAAENTSNIQSTELNYRIIKIKNYFRTAY